MTSNALKSVSAGHPFLSSRPKRPPGRAAQQPVLSYYCAGFLCRARIVIRHPEQREGSRAVLRAFSTAFRCSKNPTPSQPSTARLVGRVSRAQCRSGPPRTAWTRGGPREILRVAQDDEKKNH